jgi:predicted nucleic acid-binding protein
LILVDAGPLVALVNAVDQYHSRCVATLETFPEPMATVWPPLTEAMYLLADQPLAQEALWEMLERGALQLLALDAGDASRIPELMRKYANRPMDLADAALTAPFEMTVGGVDGRKKPACSVRNDGLAWAARKNRLALCEMTGEGSMNQGRMALTPACHRRGAGIGFCVAGRLRRAGLALRRCLGVKGSGSAHTFARKNRSKDRPLQRWRASVL